MTETIYLILWIVYGLSALIGFVMLWKLTRWQGKARYLSGLIRLLFVVVMAVPANLSTVPEFMAPAFVVALFDFFQGYEDGAFNASINLGVALVAAIVLYSIVSLILFFVHSRKSN